MNVAIAYSPLLNTILLTILIAGMLYAIGLLRQEAPERLAHKLDNLQAYWARLEQEQLHLRRRIGDAEGEIKEQKEKFGGLERRLGHSEVNHAELAGSFQKHVIKSAEEAHNTDDVLKKLNGAKKRS